MGSQVNDGNGGIHGQVSMSVSGIAVHKHVRKHIRFSQENNMAQSAQKQSCQKHFAQAMEPLPTFQSLLFNVLWHF